MQVMGDDARTVSQVTGLTLQMTGAVEDSVAEEVGRVGGSTAVSVNRRKPMQQIMPKLGTVLVAAAIAAWSGVWGPPAVAENAFVAVTGQTSVYAPRDDGDIQAGVAFPQPGRFSDRGDGTVKDNLTNLIWLKDASCLGAHKWQDTGRVFPALAAVAALNAGMDFSCANYTAGTFTDWRLPNVKELQSLIDFGFFDPALSNAAGTAKWTEGDAFSGVRSSNYWSSTTLARIPEFAWHVNLYVGGTGRVGTGQGVKFFGTNLVWPVRGRE